MDIQSSYNVWASQYDTNKNKTRDLEGLILQRFVHNLQELQSCLEIGCGTGKNTATLVKHAKTVTAVDFSEEMMCIAKEKIKCGNVTFVQADISLPWTFCSNDAYDLITFSLVLEHIEDLNSIFSQASTKLKSGGLVYVGELHPFKQYAGTKARFTDNGEEEATLLKCFTHHISDFTEAAFRHGFRLMSLKEDFDDGNKQNIPRIISLIFQKQ